MHSECLSLCLLSETNTEVKLRLLSEFDICKYNDFPRGFSEVTTPNVVSLVHEYCSLFVVTKCSIVLV